LDATTGAQVWTKNLVAAIPGGEGYATGLPYLGLAAAAGLLVVPNGNSINVFMLSTNP